MRLCFRICQKPVFSQRGSFRSRDQIIENQQQLEQEKVSRGSILDEHKKTLQTLRKDTVSFSFISSPGLKTHDGSL